MRKTAYLLCTIFLIILPACGLLLEKERVIIAEVGGEPVRLKDLFDRIRELPFEDRALANNPDLKVAIETRKKLLNQMVVDRLMVLEAKDRGITVSDEELEQALQDIPQPPDMDEERADEMPGRASNQAHKHEQPEHPEWEIEETRNKLLITKLVNEELSAEAIKSFYREHTKDKFIVDPPVVSFELATVAPENKDIVDKLYKLATEQNTSLFAAYIAMGKPPEILEAGIMPPRPLNEVVPQMREQIEGMRKFDISEPFHLVQGGDDRYVVIRLVKNKKRKPLRVVRREIRDLLITRLIENLENKFGVRYYYDKLNYRVGD